MNEEEKDYSKEPVSLAVTRAMKEGDANKVSPRDILLDQLRRIDAGEDKPCDMIIIFRERNAEDTSWDTGYVRSGSDALATIGMMERAKFMILDR